MIEKRDFARPCPVRSAAWRRSAHASSDVRRRRSSVETSAADTRRGPRRRSPTSDGRSRPTRWSPRRPNVTSAAIYHYFDSKLEMYRAVYDDAESSVSTEFGAAAAMSDTFVGQFEAILERAYQMNSRDPSLARFLASVARRHETSSRTAGGDSAVGGRRDRLGTGQDRHRHRRDLCCSQEGGERARCGHFWSDSTTRCPTISPNNVPRSTACATFSKATCFKPPRRTAGSEHPPRRSNRLMTFC